MAFDEHGNWKADLFPRQWELMGACQPGQTQNLVLASGPRFSSKTVGALHCVVQHAWEVDRANFCLISISQTVGVDSGIWNDLTEVILPDWINAGFGMEWVRKPYTSGMTKKPACIIRNKHGTESKIQLESLKNEQEAEARFKGRRYSGIFVNELSKFKKLSTFITWKQCLRMLHLPPDQHLFLADTNPPLDVGKQAWFYKLWFDFSIGEGKDDRSVAMLEALKPQLKLVKFTVYDNLSLDETRIKQMQADFAYDPDVYAAYFLGEYTTASADALFYSVFRPNFHIVPSATDPVTNPPLVMVPEPDCFELITSWDPGPTNCVAVIIEKFIQKRTVEVGGKKIEKEVVCFKILDELAVIGEDFRLEEFIENFVVKMLTWEREMHRFGKTGWRHWSDRSAFDYQVPFTDRYWHQHIYECSAGRITLMAEKGNRGAIAARVELFRKLLFEDRIFFSRERCPHVIEMVKSLRRGKSAVSVIEKGSIWKHAFDAVTYGICSEANDEMHRSVVLNMKKQRNEALVEIPV